MSKLSLHISDWLDPDQTFEFIERTRPPLVKVFGVAGLDDVKIREAKRRSPTSVFVGRFYFPEQGIERDERSPVDTVFNYDPIADAANAVQQMRPVIDKFNGVVDIWEGYNEIPIDTPAALTERERQKARNLSAFTVEMARLLHSLGQKYAAYSFSTGNPVHVDLWDLLVDGLRASDYLALHEYIAPDENWQDFNLTMCNRYREIYDRIPADARKPILITECGADYLGQQGFQGRIGAQQYLPMMAQYDRELMRDPYVVGATIFCYGIDDKRWKTYNIGGDFSRMLRDYVQANPTPPIDLLEPIDNQPEKPVEISQPPKPPQLLPLDQARWWVEEAVRKIESAAESFAHAILKDTVVPWFYASAPEHSTDLPNAQAHTAARWFSEQAVRLLESNDPQGARAVLLQNVIPWLTSPGPKALGIRGRVKAIPIPMPATSLSTSENLIPVDPPIIGAPRRKVRSKKTSATRTKPRKAKTSKPRKR